MISLKGRLQRISFFRLDIAAAVFCFAVIYSSITAFDRPTPWYHAQVSYQLIFAASILFLPFMFFPGWKFERPVANVKPWLAGGLCLGLATIFSPDYVVSVPRLRLIYSLLLIGFLLRAWFSKAQNNVIPLVLLAIALVHATILPVVFVSYDRATGNLGDYTSWLPYHSHIRHLGYHGVVAACSGLAFSLLVPRFGLVGSFLSAFALFGLIFFGSRGALLSYGLFVGIILYFCPNKRRVLATAILTVLLAWWAAVEVSHYKSGHIGTVADRSTSTASVDSRLHLWTGALVAIKNRPLLGYGPEGYQLSQCCSPGHIQAHNAVLQVLIEFGVLGFLVFAWLANVTLINEMTHFFRQKRIGAFVNFGRASVASIILCLFVYSMIDGIFYHIIPMLLFAMLCALLFATGSGKGDANTDV